MCPSYRATGEEKHSTRGRAHLLFEMLHGGPLDRTWRNEPVREALDLCLACKGCRSECPLNVDMATYKAEFFSHYYAGRVRPREAYSMGLIYWWARGASLAPGVANALLSTAFARWLGGIAPERRLPRFAHRSFRAHFRARPPTTGKRVLLFPDTFNNYFYPETASAAVGVLASAGFDVVVPSRPLCCGRPLYAWGMLDQARKQVRRILDTLGDELRAGTPIVGLEPACISAFKDEIPALFPGDERARRLRDQSCMLTDFLHESGWRPSPIGGSALVHSHCHRHAVTGTGQMQILLDALGLDYKLLNVGCCGMAGSFGFEAAHYDVAMQVGEDGVLPAVRNADAETLVVSDGFSCREQIAHATGRKVLHVAELLNGSVKGTA